MSNERKIYASQAYVDEQISNINSGASSWNDLEDKPIEPITTHIIILEEKEYTGFTTSDSYNMLIQEMTIDLVIGDMYSILWDGVEYICVAEDLSYGQYGLGNKAAADLDDTGEPFLILSMPSNNTVGFFAYDTTATAHTVGIKKVDTSLSVKEEYLPVFQSNWNQNDKAEPDYIANRPFYSHVENVEIFAVNDLAFEMISDADFYIGISDVDFEFTAGAQYTVIWDGISYACTANRNGEIGNPGIYGGTDTGEPFCIAVYDSQLQAITLSTASTHTFSISGSITIHEKVPSVYLHQPDWEQTDETAADYIKNKPSSKHDFLTLVDQSTGNDYIFYIKDGEVVVRTPESTLEDFTYSYNEYGNYYYLEEWNETLDGEPSTEFVVPRFVPTRIDGGA